MGTFAPSIIGPPRLSLRSKMYRFKTCCQWFIVLAALGALLSFGCGGNGDGDSTEVVYMSVFNAYPGSTSLDLYGPSGTITTGLGFGERTAEPVAVDRNLGSDFMLILDGAPQDFEIEEQVYSLYPQETATFMITRRDDAAAQSKLFRHQQSISPSCRIVPDNSLALTNDPISTYAFIVGWDFEGMVDVSEHDEDAEQDFIDRENIDLPQQIQDRRDRLFAGIPDHPYFVFVPLEDDESASGTLEYVWIGPEDRVDPPYVDFEEGSIFTHPNSREYIECLEDEIEGQEPEDGDPIVIDEESDCGMQREYELQLYEPAMDTPTGWIYYYPETVGNTLSDEDACSADVRIFSDFDNIFEGDHGYDGYENNVRVDISVESDVSEYFFFSLYGRPAQDPRIEKWRSSQIEEAGDGFVDMDDYPAAN